MHPSESSKSLPLKRALQHIVDSKLHLSEMIPKRVQANGGAGDFGAAVLALFSGETFLDAKILLTLRSHSVLTHKGQVALPGGTREDQDLGDPARTAIRETEEEVGLNQAHLTPVGRLHSISTVQGDFWIEPVVAFVEAHLREPLFLNSEEVADAEWVSVQELYASRSEETRELHGVEIKMPIFQWRDRKVWGLTALILDLIRMRYDTILK